MSIEPARPPSMFGATVKLTTPFPVPAALESIVKNPELLEAVHDQPKGILTATRPLPPVMGNDCTVGERVNAQAVVDVSKLSDQLPAILPALPPVSSTANNFQTPF